jgi:type VI secretion system protein VasG
VRWWAEHAGPPSHGVLEEDSMPKPNLKSLIGKLNETCRSALEQAAALCLSQTHYEVDVEHFLVKLLEMQNTDIGKILRHFEVNQSRLAADLSRAMEGFRTGNSRNPALSPRIPQMIQDAWVVASINFQAPSIRSGHLLIGLLSNDGTARMLMDTSELFKKVSVETLGEHLPDLTRGSAEDKGASSDQPSGTREGTPPGAGTKALDQFTIDITAKARKGELDPVLGRDFEIRQMADILIRRRQNNPILTGEAGVGKTAVVEGFAMKVAQGDVPPPLRNVEIRSLDLGLLQAGAGIKGEFENRLKSVINEVKASPVPIVLFIDEAHTLIGAGGAAGSGDAANLLKPALARGELRTIAATTWSEYKKYFEKDAALARRFQVIKVEEPDEDKAMVMMRAIGPFLEKHHNVMITDEALRDSVRLSHRYIPARQLPDKSVSVLDTACARVAIGLTTKPGAIEDGERRIGDIDREAKILEKESLMGRVHTERLEKLAAERKGLEGRLEGLDGKWKKELDMANKILALRAEIKDLFDRGGDGNLAEKQASLNALEKELAEVQKGDPLVQITVDGQIISEVISGWTGIPTGRMLTDEIETVLRMPALLGERIIGQDHALEAISQTIQTAHAGIEDPSKPTGVFLLVGPSGVGKTETALALSELLYGGEENLITINMSEYQEAHTVSGLKGSPPGYVGYGEGGVLTEAVRKRPYSVVLLDEIEKAHPDVTELFYQVFDKGMLEDGEGRKIDFKNTLIILTSNLGTDTIMKACADEETVPDWKGLIDMLRPELVKHFKPAFIGRLKAIPYYPIGDKNMRLIVKLKLDRIAKRMRANRNVAFVYDEALIESIASRCTEVESGARNVDHILSGSLLPQMSKELLSRMAAGEKIEKVKATLSGEGFGFEIE